MPKPAMTDKKLSASPSISSISGVNACTRHIFKLRKFFKLSLPSNLFYTFFVFIFQAYLIYEQYSRLTALISQPFSHTHISSFQYANVLSSNKLKDSIVISGLLTTFALLFSLAGLALGTFHLDIYSHDSFFLGRYFDKSKVSQEAAYNRKTLVSIISSGSNTGSDVSIQNCKRNKTKNTLRSLIESCHLVKKPTFWSELPPLGVVLNLVSSILLLIAELQLNSKRIQLGHKPVGDIFSSKLDFLFGEPINRLKKLSLTNPLNSSRLLPTFPSINNVIRSKDDFTIFMASSESIKQNISLVYLNFLISLAFFCIKLSQTFWYTSKQFTFVIFTYLISAVTLTALSFVSYEVLFKANNLKQLSSSFILSKYDLTVDPAFSADQKSQINTADNYSHDILLTLLFLTSSGLLLTNGYLNTKIGYRKFEVARLKFERSIDKYLYNNYFKRKEISYPPVTNTEVDLEKNISVNSSILASLYRSFLRFTRQYTEILLSSLLFLVYVSMRFFFIFEIFLVYKFTNDTLLCVCIAYELATILMWAIFITIFTVKSEWGFELDAIYKVNYWNFCYTKIVGESLPSSEKQTYQSKDSCIYGKSQKQLINVRQLGSNNSQFDKIKNNKATDTGAAGECSQHTSVVNKDSVVLLVRDDSLILNRSSNMSSSSITEVSSLMPSVAPIYNYQPRKNSSVLDVSNFVQQNEEELDRLKANRQSSRLFAEEVDFCYIYNDGQQDNIRRSYRKDTNNLKTNLVTSSLRTRFSNSSTIGEIMERRNLFSTKKYAERKISFGNEAPISQTTTDSGHDSLDSPIGKVDLENSPENGSNKLMPAKPYLIEASGSTTRLAIQ